jgi:hypothetical protein
LPARLWNWPSHQYGGITKAVSCWLVVPRFSRCFSPDTQTNVEVVGADAATLDGVTKYEADAEDRVHEQFRSQHKGGLKDLSNGVGSCGASMQQS